MKLLSIPFLLVLFLSFSSTNSYAQSNQEKAFRSYKKARKAYTFNNYNEAVEHFKEVKRYLGKPHILFQVMYIKSLYYTDDIQGAKEEVASYYSLGRSRNSPEFEEVKKFEKLINKRYIQDKNAYAELLELENKTGDRVLECKSLQAQYKKYLNDFPKGMYIIEISLKLVTINDKISFLYAKNRNTIESYDDYLSEHPTGIYSSKARALKRELDYSAYQKAKSIASTSAYNKYLSDYPRGKYRSEIKELLNNKLDEDEYNKASEANTITAYENYIEKFPNGNHAYYVNQIIQNSYFKWGNDAFKKKNYSSAKSYYSTLAHRYPSGKYSSEVKKQINKCNRRMNQVGGAYLMYSYDKFSPIGLSLGVLMTNEVGYYGTLKIHQDIFKGLGVLYEIDDTGKTDSPWDTKRTGVQTEANIAYSMGITFKIIYPLWGYIGGGGGYYPTYTEVDEFSSNGGLHETVWMKNTDRTGFSLFPEAGLNLKIANAVVLKYGISYRKEIIHQFGLGIQF